MSDTYDPRHADEQDVPVEPTPVEYQKSPSMMFSNQTYDKLKWVAQILLPAFGTFYAAVGVIWGLPFVNEVVGTVLAADTFLGALLALSTRTYEKSGAAYDGTATLLDGAGKKGIVVELQAHPEVIADQKQVVLKVDNEDNPPSVV